MTRLLVVLLALFVTPAEAARVYVIDGQGGFLTSMGMHRLASRLAQIPGLTVTTHPWKYPGAIVDSIKRLPKGEQVILIGYSLGAHMTTYISNSMPSRRFALLVAYDPSIYSAYQGGPGSNVKRMLLYHNNGSSTFGHARIPGRQVETTEITEGHMAVDDDERLHAKTIAAVRAVR